MKFTLVGLLAALAWGGVACAIPMPKLAASPMRVSFRKYPLETSRLEDGTTITNQDGCFVVSNVTQQPLRIRRFSARGRGGWLFEHWVLGPNSSADVDLPPLPEIFPEGFAFPFGVGGPPLSHTVGTSPTKETFKISVRIGKSWAWPVSYRTNLVVEW